MEQQDQRQEEAARKELYWMRINPDNWHKFLGMLKIANNTAEEGAENLSREEGIEQEVPHKKGEFIDPNKNINFPSNLQLS